MEDEFSLLYLHTKSCQFFTSKFWFLYDIIPFTLMDVYLPFKGSDKKLWPERN